MDIIACEHSIHSYSILEGLSLVYDPINRKQLMENVFNSIANSIRNAHDGHLLEKGLNAWSWITERRVFFSLK